MAKHFIKIQYRKKPANLLEEQVQKAILELDQTLWPTLDQAKFMVYQKFDDAVLAYRGGCKMQRPTASDHDAGMHIIYADVCNVSIYIAKRDYTHWVRMVSLQLLFAMQHRKRLLGRKKY
jgi:hypothetical protein